MDDVHGSVDAINSTHSAELTATQAAAAHTQLAAYFDRFRAQLAPGNAVHLQTLQRVIATLCRYLDSSTTSNHAQQPAGTNSQQHSVPMGCAVGGKGGGMPMEAAVVVLTVNDFLLQSGLDNINLFRLVRYIRESKAVYKVAGFAQAQAQRSKAGAASSAAAGVAGQQQEAPGGSTGALHAVVGFMQALTNVDSDGRVIVDRQAGTLRFVLLNAAAHFAKVAATARAVVLASGTLSPVEPLLQLFPHVPLDSLHRYSCGHVVGRERLLTLTVGSGPSGVKLDFRHETRATPATLDELGRLVTNVARVVPGGLVVFFPSFSYANQVYARWESTGVLRQLGGRKRVFREPRLATEVEALLQEYAACNEACSSSSSTQRIISSSSPVKDVAGSSTDGSTLAAQGKENAGMQQWGQQQQLVGGNGGGLTGAVLLCVVGGKLSEGINFGDALGRCVIMVGLPYPNPSDPELQERLRFIDRQQHANQALQAQQPIPAVLQLSAPGETATAATNDPAVLSQPTKLCTDGSSSCAGSQKPHIRTPAIQSQQRQQQQTLPVNGGSSGSSSRSGTPASREYYENLCMKAVNQCIGRVIRHRGDYAAILLVDCRYHAGLGAGGGSGCQQGTTSLQQQQQQQQQVCHQQQQQQVVFRGPLAKLPGWVQESVVGSRGSFGEAYGHLARFFKRLADQG
ncbi:hypothetical protein N2152v2_002265 [Parachlorella kessleri]